ncbi:hypothetical protein MSAN_00886900 [Mycena sanguinolenta]|uniref:Uncharacterized protein n=1 Tax=Mycena sanguinolenta TaxID=230812 RepID=A0A8H6YWP4_9AGAR|nr:hypothetical protein MSAN_00886900 [Mycena sanguinolenta]
MRRAHSARHHARPSLALGADDLGILREGNESDEDVLRRQLIEKDRENDRLQTQVEALQAQLSQRPPLETIQQLEKEYKSLDLLLNGTQRENERCMAEIERGKAREKMLERELARLAGENWQSSLDIAPATMSTLAGRSIIHQRSNTLSTMPSPVLSHAQAQGTGAPSAEESQTAAQRQQMDQATLAHIEQVRMLIMGMEQRLQTREEKLVKSVERAESEGRRFEELRSEIANSP